MAANEAGKMRVRQPLITVVVPTFNRCGLLASAIESVLGQTYTDFRLIVSDNASSDATASVVARFDDPRLVYVKRERHTGLNEHYNRFTAEIETKYMFIVPDDDRILPHALEALVPVLETHPEAGIAHGRAKLIDADGTTISPSHDMTGLDRDAVESGESFIRNAMSGTHRIHGSTVLFRTEAIRRVPLDQRDYPATEFGLWMRLALDWDIAFVAKTIAVYRIHTGSYTSTNASVTHGGYVQAPETIQNVYDVKLRFLEENRARVADPDGLRRRARHALSWQLVNYAGHATLPDRRLLTTVRVLAGCVRRDARVVLEPGAWRLLVGGVLGPRLTERIKRRRQAPGTLGEVVGQ